MKLEDVLSALRGTESETWELKGKELRHVPASGQWLDFPFLIRAGKKEGAEFILDKSVDFGKACTLHGRLIEHLLKVFPNQIFGIQPHSPT